MKTLEYDGIKIKCFDRQESLDTLGFVFGELKGGVYSHFDIEGRDVLDVGAYLGETAIWFVKKGANLVVALEPFESFNLIDQNVADNGCAARVIPMRGAISDSDGFVAVATGENSGGSNLMEFSDANNQTNGSILIPQYTLDALTAHHDLQDAILKMDCEGSEFRALLGTPREVIRRFQYAMIEVHYFAGDAGKLYQYFVDNDFKIEVFPSGGSLSFVYAERLDF